MKTNYKMPIFIKNTAIKYVLVLILLFSTSSIFSQTHSVCNFYFNTYYPHLIFLPHQSGLHKSSNADLVALATQMKNNPSFKIKIIFSYTNHHTKKLADKRCVYFLNKIQSYQIDIERFLIEYRKQTIMSDKLLLENTR